MAAVIKPPQRNGLAERARTLACASLTTKIRREAGSVRFCIWARARIRISLEEDLAELSP